MEPKLKTIKDLSLVGNKATNWKLFIEDFEDFIIGSKSDKEKDEVKIALFKNQMGEEARELLRTLELSQDDRKDYKKVIKALESYLIPKKNIIYERYVLYNRVQKFGEPFDDFLKDVKKLAESCDFSAKDEMIRDRIILGIQDLRLQEKLLQNNDIEMQKVIDDCRIAESTRQKVQEVQGQRGQVYAVQGTSIHQSSHKFDTNNHAYTHLNKKDMSDHNHKINY